MRHYPIEDEDDPIKQIESDDELSKNSRMLNWSKVMWSLCVPQHRGMAYRFDCLG